MALMQSSASKHTATDEITYLRPDGKAEVVIDGKSNLLQTGESIIIPAHRPNSIKANERFKMISTIITSGYE